MIDLHSFLKNSCSQPGVSAQKFVVLTGVQS